MKKVSNFLSLKRAVSINSTCWAGAGKTGAGMKGYKNYKILRKQKQYVGVDATLSLSYSAL